MKAVTNQKMKKKMAIKIKANQIVIMRQMVMSQPFLNQQA